MGKKRVANPVVNQRSLGGKVESHGSRSPKDLGPTKGNDQKTKRTQVNLRPEGADAEFAAGQHNGEEK